MTQSTASKPKIVGIGVSVWDQIMVVDGLPIEEQVLRAVDHGSGLGGGVSVAIATAACLNVPTVLIDCLGTDILSEAIVQTLSGCGVDVVLIDRRDDAAASIANVWVNQRTGSRTIVFAPGQNIKLAWHQRYADPVAAADWLHLNGRHLALSIRAVEVARQAGTKISYDGGAHRYRDEIVPLLKQTDVLVVAEHFARSHCAASHRAAACDLSPAQLCQRLGDAFSPSLVGVTCGHRGSWFLAGNNESFHQPATPVDPVIDTTGCGDVFHGALLAGLASKLPLQNCTDLAARAASWQAERLGAFSPQMQHVDFR